jgi:hypothetical protein
MSDELNLPWKIYFFNEDGKYDRENVLTVYTEKEFKTPQIINKIKYWCDAGLEIRVCDAWDYLIIHWLDGFMVFPIDEAKELPKLNNLGDKK